MFLAECRTEERESHPATSQPSTLEATQITTPDLCHASLSFSCLPLLHIFSSCIQGSVGRRKVVVESVALGIDFDEVKVDCWRGEEQKKPIMTHRLIT
jgi:hypothetical protein